MLMNSIHTFITPNFETEYTEYNDHIGQACDMEFIRYIEKPGN